MAACTTHLTRHFFAFGLALVLTTRLFAQETTVAPHPLQFIDTAFENASPLWWEIEPDGTVQVHLVYDQERASPNRANGHWLFRVEAEPGAELTLVLGPFANVWNRTPSRPTPEAKITFVSDDGQNWRPLDAEPVEPHRLRLRVRMTNSSLYVARLEPYRISDLDRLKADIGGHELVEITPIGRTVEQRELEMLRVGKLDAPHRILLRARPTRGNPAATGSSRALSAACCAMTRPRAAIGIGTASTCCRWPTRTASPAAGHASTCVAWT